ncbi:MAG: FtsX-like permease family protein [candidate division Zixibacteria bacterium]|nr:FtsX-like permease family protein [candidate division Zixibacteria bacterium]
MKVFKLIIRNAMRHRLRTFLTVLGLALAVMAFGLIRTLVDAWYAGARIAPPDRLVTRHAVSFTFTLPLAYLEQIQKIDGVSAVTPAVWFGGIYIDPKNFFGNFAVDPVTYLDMYKEIIVQPEELKEVLADRRGAIVGRRLADRFGWKVGDKVPLIGTIYPGNWEFTIRAIYHGRDKDTDETAFLFRFDYLDEVMRETAPGRAGQAGWFGVKINDANRAAEIGAAIDSRFKNSWAETKTETEKEFVLGFIQMADVLIAGLRIISYLIIGVILLVLVNTMVMTARERISENAFLRVLGFRNFHLIGLILGESLAMACAGGIAGMGLLAMTSRLVGQALSIYLPGYYVGLETYVIVVAAAVIVGCLASIFPIQRAVSIKIIDGLRVVD